MKNTTPRSLMVAIVSLATTGMLTAVEPATGNQPAGQQPGAGQQPSTGQQPSAPSAGQQSVGSSPGQRSGAETSSSIYTSDQAFVTQAALTGKAEVQVSEIAMKKAESEEVKAIATQIVNDHKEVNKQIKDLAKNKGISLSTTSDPASDEVVAKLSNGQTGAEFDRAYLTQLQKSHKASVAAFTEAAKDSTDSEVKAWAGTTLVAIQSHLDRIDRALAAL